MSRLIRGLIFIFAHTFSLLPRRLFYFFSDLLYLLLYFVIGYRKTTVLSNLKRSFPEKSDHEIDVIAKSFYRNFSDIILESVALFGMSPAEIKKRCTIKNPEVLQRFFDAGKNVVATIGHCGNWEMAGLATALQAPHQCITFYRPLKNKIIDEVAKKMRAKFGMQLVADDRVRQMLKAEFKKPVLYIFIADQTPVTVRTSHWVTFMEQETPVFRGAERVAKMLNAPVVFGDIQRVKRGFYSIEIFSIAEETDNLPPGKITELHTRQLERAIKRQPDNWLWSHRRWKRKKPADIKIAAEKSI